MDPRRAHRDFLNRYYGPCRHFYDLTRKYYLFGRDRVLDGLLEEPWSTLVEVGVGTGRNLRRLHRGRPEARYGGVDACDAMLSHARARLPWATLQHGFAETVELTGVLGVPLDRVVFSYTLSMVEEPLRALRNAQQALAPDGKILVVDFADFRGFPAVLSRPFRRFLAAFHVHPWPGLETSPRVRYGFGRYYLIAELGSQTVLGGV